MRRCHPGLFLADRITYSPLSRVSTIDEGHIVSYSIHGRGDEILREVVDERPA